ncbi:testis-expressed protein 49-like isoform X2 [Oncorhynchus kisutch]|uniref:testis-expressed protein 49-like isoform X2 n=1 Tax=Oncorhynchus kisutch TaxID=8019 RepID=UPI0012DBE45E|nr:testis-expressed protein 49-like isoform X2 [Oncorhynchus kisutch]
MAFFGITNLGYQNPIGDHMLLSPRSSASPGDEVDSRSWAKQSGLPSIQVQRGPPQCTDTPFSPDIHQAPNQLYSVPLTDSQQCGWWMSNGGQGKMHEPWTQVRRFPRKNSEMTKFVKEMSMTDREFSLF